MKKIQVAQGVGEWRDLAWVVLFRQAGQEKFLGRGDIWPELYKDIGDYFKLKARVLWALSRLLHCFPISPAFSGWLWLKDQQNDETKQEKAEKPKLKIQIKHIPFSTIKIIAS